jgi:hypothetical protein
MLNVAEIDYRNQDNVKNATYKHFDHFYTKLTHKLKKLTHVKVCQKCYRKLLK